MADYERKIIKKALKQLYNLGAPSFSVSQNRMIRKMRIRDEVALAYTIGLLESLVFEDNEIVVEKQDGK